GVRRGVGFGVCVRWGVGLGVGLCFGVGLGVFSGARVGLGATTVRLVGNWTNCGRGDIFGPSQPSKIKISKNTAWPAKEK
ncbi:MAG: hypothetical protein ACOCVL_02615, partial [Candidatus Sumerlaeota bacterium]